MIDHLLMSIYVLGHLVELLNYAHALRWLQIMMMMMMMIMMMIMMMTTMMMMITFVSRGGIFHFLAGWGFSAEREATIASS